MKLCICGSDEYILLPGNDFDDDRLACTKCGTERLLK